MVNYNEELLEYVVYGMIDGEETFMEALAYGAKVLELDKVTITSEFTKEVQRRVNNWKSHQ